MQWKCTRKNNYIDSSPLDKAPVTTTRVKNEMLRSRHVSATTTPLSFWKTPERKLSLTLIRRHVTVILIESPPVSDEERATTRPETANYFIALFLKHVRAWGFFHIGFLTFILYFTLLLNRFFYVRGACHMPRVLKIAPFDGLWFFPLLRQTGVVVWMSNDRNAWENWYACY